MPFGLAAAGSHFTPAFAFFVTPLRNRSCCGHRLFTANDRQSTGIARFSPELRYL